MTDHGVQALINLFAIWVVMTPLFLPITILRFRVFGDEDTLLDFFVMPYLLVSMLTAFFGIIFGIAKACVIAFHCQQWIVAQLGGGG